MKKQLSFVGPIGADTVEHLFDTDTPLRPEPAVARAPYGTRARRDQRNLIVALDIGTSKVVALVADLTLDGRVEVIGMGTNESKGLKKGVVVNIEATVNAIQRALEEAELMADCKIQRVYTGIAGSHIRSFNSTGMVAVKDREVTPLDIERAIETARAMPIPTDQQVLHILTQEFLIDGQDGIREPLGMSGVRLEVKVHIVTGAVSAAQNIVKCVRRCGLEVADLILQPLGSSIAVLSEDEKELGVALIDIGGGTTDIAIFREGAIRHTAVIPIAGDQITNDIAMALRTPTPEAELVKIRHGCALRSIADPDEMIEVPGLGDRPPRQLSRQTLAEVIEPRVEELYTLVQQVLRQSGFEELLSSGVVLTGGSAVMQGMVELGEEIFHMPVRLGSPRYSGGLADVVQSPRYATVMGLLAEGRLQVERGILARQTGSFGATLRRMREWFQRNF
jgi:cell division protein FtsA